MNTHGNLVANNVSDFLKNANILVAAGDYRLARKLLIQGIHDGHPPSELLFLVAQTYLKEKNEEKAERVLRDSIAYLPTSKAYFTLAQILISQEKDERAIQVLKRCLELKGVLSTEKIEIYRTLGNVYMKKDLLDEALVSYYKVLELKEDVDTHCSIGSCMLRLRDLEGAKSHFISAMRINPSYSKSYFGLASCALGIGNKVAALEFLVQSLERDIHNPTALFYLVKCAYELKKYDQTEKILRQYLDVSPVNSSLLYSLAGIQYHLGKKEESRMVAQSILDLNPEHSGAKNLIKIMST